MFWLMMGSFKFLGESEFSARLPAAILAIGTALATYHLARRLFSAEVGFWAGLVDASNIIFTVSARAATVDSALMFVTTLAMALFAKGARIGEAGCRARPAKRQVREQADWHSCPRHGLFRLIGVLLGLAVLAKGPVGFLLPAASLGLFLLVMNEPAARRPVPKRTSGWQLHQCSPSGTASGSSPVFAAKVAAHDLGHAAADGAGFCGPGGIALVRGDHLKTHGEWLDEFVTKYNLGPFLKPFLGHRGPFYYHFVVVLVGLFPWSVFLGPTIVNAWRAIACPRQGPALLRVPGLLDRRVLRLLVDLQHEAAALCPAGLPGAGDPDGLFSARLAAAGRGGRAPRHADRHRHFPGRGRGHAGGPAVGRRRGMPPASRSWPFSGWCSPWAAA